MSDDRHARVKRIFLDACPRSKSERPEFLDRACGEDRDLRGEVESLLAYHDAAVTEPGPHERAPFTPATTTRPSGHFEPGQEFVGRYRIVELLGTGGMGEVYRAHDLVLDVPVAVKLLGAPRRGNLERMLDEVRLARRVTHPKICRVFDVGQVDGEYYITMEYVDGEDLSSLLRRIGRFPGDKLLDLARQLCAGLAAAHAKGVLHRDLKPGNLLIDSEGELRITDFGIATTVSRHEPSLIGTPAYMAPELLSGAPASVQSDLYALGLVLHEMATGRPVFRAATPREYARLHRSQPPEMPSERVTEVDSRLETVILRCLEKDPRRRPSSALEVAAALPGGDPLGLALEVGATPSPELVAKAADADQILRPRTAAVLMASLLVLLAVVWQLSDCALLQAEPRQIKAPEVLVERAGEILGSLRHDVPAVGRAWGFMPRFATERGETSYFFWYRQAPFPLVPSDAFGFAFSETRVDLWDPPATTLDEGMVQMVLDSRGRLVMFYIIPPILAEDLPEEIEGGPDYEATLAFGGFEMADLRPVEPRKVPPVYADQWRSWIGADPRDGERPEVQIDTAAFGGRLVYFSAWTEDVEEDTEGSLLQRLQDATIEVYDIALMVLVGAAVLLARANFRRGRGDLEGARHLVLFVVVAKLLHWLLDRHYVPDLSSELVAFQVTFGVVLVEALLVWLAYIALEPTSRRYWPQTLIAWNRLLRGNLRDPLIGRNLLIGAVVGAGWTLLVQLDALTAAGLGFDTSPAIESLEQLEVALSGRLPFANLLQSLLSAVYTGVLQLFLLAVLRLVWRVPWRAVVSFVVLVGAYGINDGAHPAVSWLSFGILIAGTSALLLVRFGLFSYIAALFCYKVLASSPITADLGAWFASTGLFGLLVPVVLGGFGFWTALGGRPLAAEWLEPPQATIR